jgi:hypothetical protein
MLVRLLGVKGEALVYVRERYGTAATPLLFSLLELVL